MVSRGNWPKRRRLSARGGEERISLAVMAASAAFALASLLPGPAAGAFLAPAAVDAGAGPDEGQERAGPALRTLHRPHAIDGDTLRDDATGERFRLIRIDAPESGQGARCPAEAALAQRATHAARQAILGARQVQARLSGRIDRYGRTLASISLDGRDLAQLLLDQGLARPWTGRREAWCGPKGELLR